MREIEAKYRVHDVEGMMAALKRAGVDTFDRVSQDDQAFMPPGWDYSMSKIGEVFARLRSQDGVHTFTAKQPVGNEMECVEYESTVSDRDAMHGALVAMGWVPSVRIVKTRRAAVVDDLAVCVDEVDHAGTFLEVEMLVDDDRSGAEMQDRLDRVVIDRLGLDAAVVTRTTDTYDSLVRAATTTEDGTTG